MKNTMVLWLKEMRANFLVLPVVLVAIGGAAAHRESSFHSMRFVVSLLGVIAAHISVNLFNEYSDWRTGIDSHTQRTPFSGGSGNLQEGLLQPGHVRFTAWATLVVAFLTGVYLAVVAGWQVVLFMGVGGIAIVFYTDVFTKWMLGELASGITLGSLVVIGAYLVQTGHITTGIVWLSISPGLLTTLLLLLNEFPDVDADREGGRRHMLIVLGPRISSIVYTVLMGCVYVVIVAGVALKFMPSGTLISLVTLPLAVAVSYRVIRYNNQIEQLVSALGINVMIVLITDFMLAIGMLLP